MNRNTLFFRGDSLLLHNIKETPPQKRRVEAKALSSVFLFFVSSYSCCLLSFCLVFFLVMCFFLFSFSFVIFFSFLFECIFVFCCSHPCCPLLMYSLFVFASIVPTVPCSAYLVPTSSSYSFSPSFSPFVYVLFQHDTPPKKTQKPDFAFTDKPGWA